MRLTEDLDADDFDADDFEVDGVGGGPPLWLILKPKPEIPQLRPRKRKKKKKVSKDLFRPAGMPLPSPQFLHMLDVLDALDYLDALVLGE